MKKRILSYSCMPLLLLASQVAQASTAVVTVPEPSTWSLVGMGIVAAIVASRFKKNK